MEFSQTVTCCNMSIKADTAENCRLSVKNHMDTCIRYWYQQGYLAGSQAIMKSVNETQYYYVRKNY